MLELLVKGCRRCQKATIFSIPKKQILIQKGVLVLVILEKQIFQI